MVTIYDIAKKTGLSASTVARALAGNGYCSKRARKIVLDAANELGYVPHQAAKTLKNSITNNIMLCIPDIMNPYYFAMINGATKTLETFGYNIILGYTMHSPKKELEVLNTLKGRFVDGLIFGSFDYTPKLIRAIQETNLPTVLTSFYENGETQDFYDCVYVDQSRAAFTATRHCIDRGHKRIVFLGGEPGEQNTRERFAGYQKALAESGLAVDEGLVLAADFTLEGGYRAIKGFVAGKPDFTAVVACNDLMGVGCMNACRELKLKIPGDVSIISLDNTEYCLCTNPAMSSVDMMQAIVGEESANYVMDRLLNKRSFRKDVALTPHLYQRESVKTLR